MRARSLSIHSSQTAMACSLWTRGPHPAYHLITLFRSSPGRTTRRRDPTRRVDVTADVFSCRPHGRRPVSAYIPVSQLHHTVNSAAVQFIPVQPKCFPTSSLAFLYTKNVCTSFCGRSRDTIGIRTDRSESFHMLSNISPK